MRALIKERYWRTPFDHDDNALAKSVVHIQEDRCKGCAYCAEFCPTDVLSMSERYNRKGYHPPDVTDAMACTACRLCEILCPEFAIVIEEPEAATRRQANVV